MQEFPTNNVLCKEQQYILKKTDAAANFQFPITSVASCTSFKILPKWNICPNPKNSCNFVPAKHVTL